MAAPLQRAITVASPHGPLLGLLSTPGWDDVPVAPEAAVLVVHENAQYRAGPHRLFVRLARELARAGVACLRFDRPGTGDTPGAQQPFDAPATRQAIRAAIDTLAAHVPTARHIVLWGIGDGASAALLYLHGNPDPRVTGLVLMNPWVGAASITSPTGVPPPLVKAGPTPWKTFVDKLRLLAASRGAEPRRRSSPHLAVESRSKDVFTERMVSAAQRFEHPLLLLLSENDPIAQAFTAHCQTHPRWQSVLHRPGTDVVHLPAADHTATDADAGQVVLARSVATASSAAVRCGRSTPS